MFRKNAILAIDVGSSLIKVILVEGTSKKPVMAKCNISTLPSHAIVDGEIMDRETVLDSIRSNLEILEISEKQTVSCVSGRDVIVKKIKMPKMNKTEATEQIKWEAEQYIPYEIEDISLDFEILNPDTGEDSMEVLLVGAKRNAVDERLHLLRDLDLEPVVLDIAAFSLQNIYEFNHTVKTGELIGLFHIGFQYTTMSFVESNINHFTREVPTAVNTLVQAIQREAGIDGERALDIIKTGEKGDIDQYAYQNAMESFQDDLGIAIERVLPYLPEGFENFNQIVISGGGSLIPGMPEFLEKRFGTTVEVLDPFINFAYDRESSFININAETMGPIIAPALGLSLRGL
ncbi:type IV pilus assembly protein PilM [candidate division WOR-3 bacterium]|nr:type IV pilus assembly protein PilM [candidate division WOR-3 bacterium]MCK4526715.1 type IV pilus assembly protein PilM [candidate division WOR-3 bacterium]